MQLIYLLLLAEVWHIYNRDVSYLALPRNSYQCVIAIGSVHPQLAALDNRNA